MDGLGLGETAWAGWDDVVLVGAVKNWRRRRVRQVERSGESTTTHMGWMGHARASRGGETDNQDLLLCGEKQKQTDKRKSKHGNKAQK